MKTKQPKKQSGSVVELSAADLESVSGGGNGWYATPRPGKNRPRRPVGGRPT